MSPNEVFQVLMDNSIANPRFDPNLGQLLVGSLQLFNLFLQRLNLPLLIQIHQTPMINLMLNNLGLSLKDGAGILMIGNFWRAPIIEIVTDWIGNEIERVAFGVATLVMKSSQGC